jgi:hypothetical protein
MATIDKIAAVFRMDTSALLLFRFDPRSMQARYAVEGTDADVTRGGGSKQAWSAGLV